MGHDMSDPLIVVTGASGPLAQEVSSLLAKQHQVIGITRKASAAGLLSLGGVVYRGWDYLDQNFDDRPIRAFIHLAAQVDFSLSLESIVNCTRANILRTIDAVQFCERWRVPRLIYASTVSVYGHDGQTPKSERSLIGPSSAYAASKWMGEQAVQTAKASGIETSILRYSGIYGQCDRQNPVLNRFIQQAGRGERIQVSSPDSKRDYVYLKDAARAAVLAMESATSGIFNIASGISIPIIEMAEQVCRILGGSFEVLPVGQCEPTSNLAFDISEARRHLKFDCQYELTDALEDIRARVTVP